MCIEFDILGIRKAYLYQSIRYYCAHKLIYNISLISWNDVNFLLCSPQYDRSNGTNISPLYVIRRGSKLKKKKGHLSEYVFLSHGETCNGGFR